MARLIFSRVAAADMDAITAFSVEQFGHEIASAYLAGLEAACELLCEFPKIAAIHPKLKPEMRCLVFRSHRIFYQTSGAGVFIVRVLHHAQDERSALG